MKKVLYIVLVLAMMLGALEAAPFQTLGMLRTPDAYVLPHKAAEFLLVGYYRDIKAPVVSKDPSLYMMAGVGLMDRIELGLFLGDKVDKDMPYFLNFKIKVMQETMKLPQITVGMDNVFSPVKSSIHDLNPGDSFYEHPDKADYERYSPYVVASKQAVVLGLPWMFNMGIGANRFAGQVKRSRIFNGIFASAEFAPFRNFYVQGEYSGHDFNAGLKYTYKNWGVKLGMQAIEDLNKTNNYKDNVRIGLGISYLMDHFSDTKRDYGRPQLWQYTDSGYEFFDYDSGYYAQDLPKDSEGVVIPPTGDTSGSLVVDTGSDGTQVVTGDSGTHFQSPGLTPGSSSSYSSVNPEINELREELRILREEREKAQKSLEDLRLWIQQLKAQQNP